MEFVSGRRREWLIAYGDQPMPAGQQAQFFNLCQARRDGQPLAYLLGQREFYSRSFQVTPEVLIPRAESEVIVHSAIALAPQQARVLDMGTGSGALAITLALERPDLTVTGSDLSQAALNVAARNANTLGAAVTWCQGDWLDAVSPDSRFELIMTNPPYIATGDEHLQQGDLRFEPTQALSSGADGLDDIRKIVTSAARAMVPGGFLLIEHGWQQAPQVRQMLSESGYTQIRSVRDDLGHERISLGQSPPD